jgi:23S rRNA pseudouridine2605 synthase
MSSDIRLAKLIAERGYCSRRKAEDFILEGRVQVEGQVHTDLGEKVFSDCDILIDNKPLEKEIKGRIWAFHKPTHLICSHEDPENRQTIYAYLKNKYASLSHLISVGRLDYMSEGLLLLTNKGSYAHQLEKPSESMIRTYDIKVAKEFTPSMISALSNGITIDDIRYKAIKVHPLEQVGSKNWYRFKLTEGKNREIRKILEYFHIPLARLKRVAYGPIKLGSLEKGALKELSSLEIKTLLKTGEN